MGKKKKKSRLIQRLPNWVSFIFVFLMKHAPCCLFKIKIENPHKYLESEENVIIISWHNRLLFLTALFPDRFRRRTKAIVSASRDGQYIADLAHQFGVKTLRGSSSSKASSVQRNATRAIQEGWHVAFTPDGPRGPKYKMQRGPVHLASLTGARIIPVSVNASRYWQLKSWDNFQIPKPFSRLTFVVGDAITVPKKISSKEDMEIWRKKAEASLMKITLDRN
jgi:lysophospholipid acyltransferase (LPLAT)-like uncharacterized protein